MGFDWDDDFSFKNVMKKDKKDENLKKISNEALDEAEQAVMKDKNYGPEFELITKCFSKYPENTDPCIVAFKVCLIDSTNTTNLGRHKSRVNIDELANHICKIKNIDQRLKDGDPTLVNEIANVNNKINLFSFASKYCCYHNRNVYGKDDYSIFDSIVKEFLPKYCTVNRIVEVTESMLNGWKNSYDYKSFNDFITKKLNDWNITTPFRRRKLDWFLWYFNRTKK